MFKSISGGFLTNHYNVTMAVLQKFSRKWCSKIFSQIYSRSSMQKCDFDKVAKQSDGPDGLFDSENSTTRCSFCFPLACIPYLGTITNGKQLIT